MLGIKVLKENAESLKVYLKSKKLLDRRYRVFARNKFIYFPIIAANGKKELQILKKRFKAEEADAEFQESGEKTEYRQALLDEIGQKNYEAIAKGYDVFGNIAVISADKKVAKKVAKIVMDINKNVKTVLNKSGAVKGKFRIRAYTYVAGKKNYIVTYRENDCTFTFDIRDTFFSTRLAFERNRIVNLVKKRENVMVMFAGIGPFAIEIAKKVPSSRVVAIELNPKAYRYLLENIKLNKVTNVVAERGDVNKIAKKYPEFADRIIMPLPNDSYRFLNAVLLSAAKNAIVHYYAFGDIVDPSRENIKKVSEFFAKNKRKVAIANKRVVRPYSAMESEVVIDFIVKRARKA
jgi:tRNA (guanine37-N1)-methyltransferase